MNVDTTAATGLNNYNIDLVVVGKRGLSGFKKLLLGNVATNTISYAHCPVTVVK